MEEPLSPLTLMEINRGAEELELFSLLVFKTNKHFPCHLGHLTDAGQ